MFFFGRKKKDAKDPSSKQYKWQIAELISGKHIRYVAERKNNEEFVIGRNGSVGIKDECVIVNTDTHIAFRARIEDTVISELLSKNGAILTGPDMTQGGEERTVVIFYVYHR